MEFLLDKACSFHVIEMNTRIQVEHPVTECVTGIDIVAEMLRISAGEPLRYKQGDIKFQGAAIECRVCAEDPSQDFRPCAGVLTEYVPPGGLGVRIDGAACQGYRIPPHYDSLIAKVITWGRDRDEAIRRLPRALGEFEIDGGITTIPFLQRIIGNAFFQRGETCMNFIQRRLP